MSATDYGAFRIGRRFRIVPPGTPAAPEPGLDIVMARGAFGSGEHETTASCLEFMEGLPELPGRTVLDLGSGTAILAIAALKLGAASAMCVDPDPVAVASARENCRLNHVADRVRHLRGELADLPDGRFGAVLCNLYGDLLLELGPGLVARAEPGAPILLSGILWEYNYDVRHMLERQGCEIVANRMLTQYSSVLARR